MGGREIWEISYALQKLWLKVPDICQDRAPSRVPILYLGIGALEQATTQIWELSGAWKEDKIRTNSNFYAARAALPCRSSGCSEV
jgi:hypothetical protein